MALYSFKGARPTQLPNRIKLSNGFTKTDSSTFTEADLADAGWIPVEYPPVVEYPNKLEWDGGNMQWVIRSPNDTETQFKWQEIRNECQKRLEATDYKVIKAVEAGVPLEPAYVNYRQALRDLYNNVNNVDPWAIQYPVPVFSDQENSEAIK